MDIRHFFGPKNNGGTLKRAGQEDSITSEPGLTSSKVPRQNISNHIVIEESTVLDYTQPQASTSVANRNQFDLGEYINLNQDVSVPLSDDMKYSLLTNPIVRNSTCDFKQDVETGKIRKRSFQKNWLEKYSWLVYSPKLKGGLCKFCTIFRPVLKRGLFGAFVVRAHQDYKHFHEDAKSHEQSNWHHESISKAKSFTDSIEMKKKNVIEQIDSGITELINANREKLRPILASLIFCGTHDISIRGKHSNQGNFEDLLQFRVSSGDKVLKNHLENHGSKAKYTSHRVQNDLINVCGSVLQGEIVDEVNKSVAFSLLADETADISGKEQLSVGVRFVVEEEPMKFDVKEEFLGFSELSRLDAEGISSSILSFVENIGLDMTKLIGLGFDGCSTMAGHESGVQARIKEKYPKAVYYHCASHRLNLVVNDLNNVQEIRNSVGTIKQVIQFFRESVLRRKSIKNIPLFCETRWSQKYKSIRLFKEHFLTIKESLGRLASDRNVSQETRTHANQLDTATSSAKFIICLIIISRYSSYLEPVVNKLQSIDMDLHKVHQYINTDLLGTFKSHREENSNEFSNIFEEVTRTCNELDIDIKIPRLASRQTKRFNVECGTCEDYFRASIYNPYIDSLIMSLSTRFENSNEVAFKGGILHPLAIKKLHSKEDYMTDIKRLQEFYNIDNLEGEARLWFDLWKSKEFSEKTTLQDVLTETTFHPAVREMIIYYQTIPPTTCTVERSFSTLRRVKTWLRSTIGEERLSGLCLLSLHRNRVKSKFASFQDKVIDQFGQKKRNLQFAFSDKY